MTGDDLVPRLTADCPRENCAIECLGSVSTSLPFRQLYDKRGRPTQIDPNTTTTSYRCVRCGVSWHIHSREGESDEITRQERKEPAA